MALRSAHKRVERVTHLDVCLEAITNASTPEKTAASPKRMRQGSSAGRPSAAKQPFERASRLLATCPA